MAKLLVALYLLCGGAHAMGIYGGEKNGCGQPCAGVETLNTEPFHIESNICYVVDGTFPSGDIEVPEEVECAKITVPSGSGLFVIGAHLPRPSFVPRETLRRGARRSTATTR